MAKHHLSKQVLEILETIPNSFYVLDKDWNFIYANGQIERLLNKSLDELIGTQFWDVFPKANFPHLYEQFTRATETDDMVSFEEYSPLYKKWFEICIYPTNLGMAVYVTDVTARKDAEDGLRRTKEELQDFLENATVGIHWVNEEGTILYVNRAELELLGYSKEEYLGHNIAEFYVDQEEIADIFRRLKSKKEIQNNEVKLRCKNGTIRHALVSSNVNWKEGQFIHTRCFTRDITIRKKNENLLMLLNQVSQQLVSELEFDLSLDRVAKLIVPHFADWFAIYLLKNNSVELLKLEHMDTGKLHSADTYRKKTNINLNKFKPNSMGWVLKIGKPVHLEQVSTSDLENIATDPEQLKLLQNLEIKSLIFVPMIMKGAVIGAVSFISISPYRVFDAQDFAFAQDLVARIAFSVENVRLFDEAKALKARYIRETRQK